VLRSESQSRYLVLGAFEQMSLRCVATSDTDYRLSDVQANHFVRFSKEKIPYAMNRYINETKRLFQVRACTVFSRGENISYYCISPQLPPYKSSTAIDFHITRAPSRSVTTSFAFNVIKWHL
jgi:hypothetical protein